MLDTVQNLERLELNSNTGSFDMTCVAISAKMWKATITSLEAVLEEQQQATQQYEKVCQDLSIATKRIVRLEVRTSCRPVDSVTDKEKHNVDLPTSTLQGPVGASNQCAPSPIPRLNASHSLSSPETNNTPGQNFNPARAACCKMVERIDEEQSPYHTITRIYAETSSKDSQNA